MLNKTELVEVGGKLAFQQWNRDSRENTSENVCPNCPFFLTLVCVSFAKNIGRATAETTLPFNDANIATLSSAPCLKQ
ncbi:MAG: hypothetical protein Q7R95_03535 [bacterium]|nr:hypothetical protein [bacterium]